MRNNSIRGEKINLYNRTVTPGRPYNYDEKILLCRRSFINHIKHGREHALCTVLGDLRIVVRLILPVNGMLGGGLC